MFSPLENVSISIFILFYETYGGFSLGAILARLHGEASAALNDAERLNI